MEYPMPCELCTQNIESAYDLEWHGYGNCVEITDEMWAQWEQEAKEQPVALLPNLGRRGVVTFSEQHSAEHYLRVLPPGYDGVARKEPGASWIVSYHFKGR